MPFLGLFGSPDIEKLKSQKDIQRLLKILENNKDHSLRINAIKALGELQDKEAIGPLSKFLFDSNEDIQEETIRALFTTYKPIFFGVVSSLIKSYHFEQEKVSKSRTCRTTFCTNSCGFWVVALLACLK